MKKTGRVELRVEEDAWPDFRLACARHGITVAAVIRDLCAAAIPYMAEHCPPGRWIAPSLVPYGASRMSEVTQIHNGKGRQVAKVKKGKKT